MVGFRRIAVGIAVGSVVACGPSVDAGDDGTSTDPTAEGPEGPEGEGPEEGPEGPSTVDTGADDGGGILVTDERSVDLILVVDNSGSMGEEQGRFVAAIGALVEQFDAEGVDYRIGVTTTDNGNPWCSTTGPEAGKFIASSCLARTGDFVFTGDPPADATAIACTDRCSADELGILPTTTELDPSPSPRPWIENIAGVSNLASLTPTEALHCMVPQGIAGCGFEQPLESMYKSLLRSENGDDPQFGFVRTSAVLAVVLVSDETDCSYSNDWQSIFSPESEGGNPAVFWEDPDAASPSSAVCWNAGVACTGGPGVYDECHAENYDVDGNPGVEAGDAVMHSLARYIDYLQEIEDRKREYVPDQQVVFAALTGVPVGYETGMAELVYQDAGDPLAQLDFGIGSGCVNNTEGGFGVPPVREREVAEAFEIGDQRNAYSICASDYSPALSAIANSIVDQMHPPCYPACVADTNPVTTELDPQCAVIQQSPNLEGGIDEVDVPPCEGGAVPDGAEVCYEALTGDALSAACSQEGWNLELRFVRPPGVPAPPAAAFDVTCQLSTQNAIDCPDL
jgi:hypothetical protein